MSATDILKQREEREIQEVIKELEWNIQNGPGGIYFAGDRAKALLARLTRLRTENEWLRERLVVISEYGHLSGESLAYMATRALTDQEREDG